MVSPLLVYDTDTKGLTFRVGCGESSVASGAGQAIENYYPSKSSVKTSG
jgi:hypothetical protein